MNKLSVAIKMIGFGVIVAVFFLYSIFGALFAKFNLHLHFWSVPVFIGEIVLLFLLFLLAVYLISKREKIAGWHFILLIYTGTVLFAAFWGFIGWGGLAFRHAALFYYPLFAVIAYYFFEPALFTSRLSHFVLAACIIVCLIFTLPTYYFVYSYCMLLCVVLYLINKKLAGVFGLLFVPYYLYINNQFNGSKGTFVAICISFVYLLIAGCIIISQLRDSKNRIYWISFFIFSSAIIFYATLDGGMIKRIVVWGNIHRDIAEYKTNLDMFVKPVGRSVAVEHELGQINQASAKKIHTRDNGHLRSVKEARVLDNHAAGQDLMGISRSKKNIKIFSSDSGVAIPPNTRTAVEDRNNILWRVYVWKDMLSEVIHERGFLGFGFGKPFRSRTVEALRWESGEKMGWLEPHNSYIHIIYRTGLFGLLLIIILFGYLFKLLADVVRLREIVGILTAGVLLYWFCLASFIVLLELPYFAIPLWIWFGATVAYHNKIISSCSYRKKH